jgi:flagellin-like protein
MRTGPQGKTGPSLPDADRSISPVVGAILMVAIVVVLAAVAATTILGFSDEPGDPGPTVSLDTEFGAYSDIDPHWQFEIRHQGGDTIPADELLVRFTDDYDSNSAEGRYPEQLTTGDRFRVGLWGRQTRASDSNCLVPPESDIPSQLTGFNDPEHATEVTVTVVHEPSNTVLSDRTVDLSEEPNRFTGDERHYLVDGVVPSIDCPDVPDDQW